MKMIGRLSPQKKLETPLFFSLAQESIVNSLVYASYFSTTSTQNRRFRQSIMAGATNTNSIQFGDSNTNCGNIKDSFNTTVYKSDKDAHIMHWLSPLEPGNRHDGVRTNRVEGIGDWLLETSEFREWRGGEGGADRAVLLCSGNPGVGKTHLK